MSTQVETPDLDLQEPSNRGGPSLLQIAWQRKSLVILGLMVGMVLGLLYYAQRAPLYQTGALVLVVSKSPMEDVLARNAGPNSTQQWMNDYMSTQAVLIKSPLIIERAVQVLGELHSFPGERPEEMVYSIRDSLTVQRDTKETSGAPNNILNIAFRGPVASECPEILNAIIAAHQSYLNELYKTASNQVNDLMREAQTTLVHRLTETKVKMAEFRTKAPDFMMYSSQGGNFNIYADRLHAIEKIRSEYRIKMAETQTQLDEIKKVYHEKGPQEAMYRIMAAGLQVNLLKGNEQVNQELLKLQASLEKLTKMNGFGPNHPDVVYTKDLIDLFQRAHSQGMSILNNPVPHGDGAKDAKADMVQVYLKAMEVEIQNYKTLVTMHTEMFEKEKGSARELNDLYNEDQLLRDEFKSVQTLSETIDQKLRSIDLVKDVGGYTANTIARPGLGAKVSPKAIQVFPIAGIAGLLAGLCLAYLAEISDKSFRTPAEIRRRLGLPVIGHIPFYGPDENATKQQAAGENVVDPMICTHYASNSLSSEAYRSVRTALYFNTQGVGHQVIQVTSPNVSDGKSTLAANLAVSIAQSGKRTILIDADCRRPRAHKIFAVTAETGLATVIAGQSDLAAAIKQTAVANLSLLPCGPRPANPSELLTSPRFKELLDIIRSQYDFVIVDTPPLLVVTDPCVVAPRVDGVIMAIRVTKNGRPFAERAKEILASLGANVLGVVVNGLGSQTGGRYGYGYDQYSYGYQYGYTYRYSYTYADEYSDDKAASYYRDTPAVSESIPGAVETVDVPALPPADAPAPPAAERTEG